MLPGSAGMFAGQALMGSAMSETSSAISDVTGAAGGGLGSMLGIGQLGLTAGMGILSIFQKRADEAKQKFAQQVEFAQNMSNRNWETLDGSVKNLLKNIEISRINQARFRQNREIGRAAMEYKALSKHELHKDTGSKLRQINQGLHSSMGKLSAAATGSGLSTNSGTYKALKNQFKANAGATLESIKINDHTERQNIQRAYEGLLAKRDLFSYNMPSYYVPSQPPQNVASPGNNFMDYASAGLSGAAEGLNMVNTIGQLEMNAGADQMSTW